MSEKPAGGSARRVRSLLSPLALAMPIGVSGLIGGLTHTVAGRAGYPPLLAALIALVIGLLWLTFFIGRLVAQRAAADARRKR